MSRILCYARILSTFDGAAEIQAQVIARRLLESSDKVALWRPRTEPLRKPIKKMYGL